MAKKKWWERQTAGNEKQERLATKQKKDETATKKSSNSSSSVSKGSSPKSMQTNKSSIGKVVNNQVKKASKTTTQQRQNQKSWGSTRDHDEVVRTEKRKRETASKLSSKAVAQARIGVKNQTATDQQKKMLSLTELTNEGNKVRKVQKRIDTATGASLKQVAGGGIKAYTTNSNRAKEYEAVLENAYVTGKINKDEYEQKLTEFRNTGVGKWGEKNKDNKWEQFVGKINAHGTKLNDEGNAMLEKSKEGLGRGGKAAIDAYSSALSMAADMAKGPLWWVSIGSRSFGNAINSNKDENGNNQLSTLQDVRQASIQSFLEMGTEAMFGGVGMAKKMVGSKALVSTADKLAASATSGIANDATRNLLYGTFKYATGIAEENIEEFVSWALDPILSYAVNGNAVEENYARKNAREYASSLLEQVDSICKETNLDTQTVVDNMVAMMQSDEWNEGLMKQLIDSGAPKDQAETVARLLNSYLEANLSGDVNAAEEYEGQIVDELAGKFKGKQAWDADELLDTILSTTIMTGVTGVPGVAAQNSYGNKIKSDPDVLANMLKQGGVNGTGVDAMIENLMNSTNAKTAAKAQASRDYIDKTGELTNYQIAELAQDFVNDNKSNQGKINNAVERTDSDLSKRGITIGASDDTFKATMTRAMDEARSVLDDEQFGNVMGDLAVGELTTQDFATLSVSHEDNRSAYNKIVAQRIQEDGVNVEGNEDVPLKYKYLPVIRNKNGLVDSAMTNEATQDFLVSLAMENRVAEAELETRVYNDVEQGNIIAEAISNMDRNGMVAYNTVARSMQGSSPIQFKTASLTFEKIYKAARNGAITLEELKSLKFPVGDDIVMSAFEAGLKDNMVASTGFQYRKKKGGIDIESKHGGKLIIEPGTNVRGSMVDALMQVTNTLNITIHLASKVRIKDEETGDVRMSAANGAYYNGEIYLAQDNDFSLNLGYTFMHEYTHMLQSVVPKEYAKYKKAVIDAYKSKYGEEKYKELEQHYLDLYGPIFSTYKSVSALEGDVRQDKIVELAQDEMVCDCAREFLNDKSFVDKISKTNPGLAKSILNSIRDMLRKLRTIIASGISGELQNDFFKELDYFKEAEDLWLEAVSAAIESENERLVSDSTMVRESRDYTFENGKARWTEDRIDTLISQYGADDPQYAKAWATTISPKDFLKLTVGDDTLQKWNDTANNMPSEIDNLAYEDAKEYVKNKYKETGESLNDYSAYRLDREQLTLERQTPFLMIYSRDGNINDDPIAYRVDGHEGRHRMRALAEAGIDSVAITVIDYDSKYTKEHMPSMVLGSQDFGWGPVNGDLSVVVNDLVPINEINRGELIEKFGGDADIKFSYSETEEDREYMDAVKRKDWSMAQYLVHKAAKRAGFDSPDLYHGTYAFGFTEFNDDGVIFTSTKREVAANYGGSRDVYAGVRKIGKRYIENATSNEDILSNANTVYEADYRMTTHEDRNRALKEVYDKAWDLRDKMDAAEDSVNTWDFDEPVVFNTWLAYTKDLIYAVNEGDESLEKIDESPYTTRDEHIEYLRDGIEKYKEYYGKLREYLNEHYDAIGDKGEGSMYQLLTSYEFTDLAIDIEDRYFRALAVKDLAYSETYDFYASLDRLKESAERTHKIGAYHLLGNVGAKPYIVDANRRMWTNIVADIIDDDDFGHSTDYIAKAAKEQGYTAVVIKNVADGGPVADNYMFFDANQIKSADVVVYDDAGNVIPLSERFNSNINDIRYSINDTDSTGTTLTEGQMRYFGNSKNVDDDGNLLRMYHGTLAEFYVFDREYGNAAGDWGKGFYASSSLDDVEENYANMDGADVTAKIEEYDERLLNNFKYDGVNAELFKSYIEDTGNGKEYLQRVNEAINDGAVAIDSDDVDPIILGRISGWAAMNKFIKASEPLTLEVYANITNPVYVLPGGGGTWLFDEDNDISFDDFENEDDYYEALDEALYRKVEDVVNSLTGFDAELGTIRRTLTDVVVNGGMTLDSLKKQFDVLDDDGEFANGELCRQIVEALGYDGIIDKSVSYKFNRMNGLYNDTVHTIVFNSEQYKNVDNENPTSSLDIRYSVDESLQSNYSFQQTGDVDFNPTRFSYDDVRYSPGDKGTFYGAQAHSNSATPTGNAKTNKKTREVILQSGQELLRKTMDRNIRLRLKKEGIKGAKATAIVNSEIDNVMNFMKHMNDLFVEMSLGSEYTYVDFDDTYNASVKVRRDGQGNITGIALSSMIKNGEYPVNFDFTTVCKKRQAFNEIIERLTKEIGDDVPLELTDKDLMDINEALKKDGVETACLGCFVEARRYHMQSYTRKVVTLWNSLVDDYAIKHGIDLDSIENFNFANGEEPTDEQYQAAADTYFGYANSKEEDEINKKTPEGRFRGLISKSNGAFLKHLTAADLVTPTGIERINQLSVKDYKLLGMFKSAYGVAAPKETISYAPYNSELLALPQTKNKKPYVEYLYKIGGARIQSFSDFLIANCFDYMQMVADAASRGFPAHAYTKEIAFAKIFGLTGMKINLSVMFDVKNAKYWSEQFGVDIKEGELLAHKFAGLQAFDSIEEIPEELKEHAEKRTENGVTKYITFLVSDDARAEREYDKVFNEELKRNGGNEGLAKAYADEHRCWIQSINFNEAVSLARADGYRKNCGIIGVGTSDECIVLMLGDNDFSYVIPYHASGLPDVIKRLTNLEYATNYEDTQNTRIYSGITYGDKTISLKDLKRMSEEAGSWRAAYKELHDNNAKYLGRTPEDGEKKPSGENYELAGTAGFDFYAYLRKGLKPQEISEKYLEYCFENELLPVFPQFAWHENYYKLLIDYSVVDIKTGETTPQGPLTNQYPGVNGNEGSQDFSQIDEIIKREAKIVNEKNKERDAVVDKIVNAIKTKKFSVNDVSQDVQYSFAGSKALGADLKAKNQAIILEAEGLDAEGIRMQTGWFRNADGYWRWEIDNSEMTIDKSKVKEKARLKLDELVNHPKLFKAYPLLRDYDVYIHKMGWSTVGSFSHDDKKMELNSNFVLNDKHLTTTLVHELQHAIQGFEGFERGASTSRYKMWRGIGEKTAWDMYQRTAGEIEARDVEARINMNETERKWIRPDIRERKDVVFVSDYMPGGVHWNELKEADKPNVKQAVSKYKDDPHLEKWHQEDASDSIISRLQQADARYSIEPMNVLVACEESQAVCKELRRLGHNAYSCDIQEQSGGHPEWHIKGDVTSLLNGNCDYTLENGQTGRQDGKWDMIIAFPPCTHLATSGAKHFEKKREDGRQREAIEFFCSFFDADCEKLVIENPRNIIGGKYIEKWYPDIVAKYGSLKRAQEIQPWMFGDNYSKATCLWLRGVPELTPDVTSEPEEVHLARDKNGVPLWYNKANQKDRSKTFPGVARAMADTWAGPVEDARFSMDETEQPPASEDDAYSWMFDHADELGGSLDDMSPADKKIMESRQRRLYLRDELKNYAKDQQKPTRFTHDKVMNPKSVKDAVRQLVIDLMQHSEYDGKYKTKDVNFAVDSCSKIFRLCKEEKWDEATDLAYDTASEIIEDTTIVDDYRFAEYKEVRDWFKSQRIYVPDEIKRDFIKGYGAFRRQNFGKLTLTNNSNDTAIDSMYQAAEERFGKLLKPEGDDLVSMLEACAELIDSYDNYRIAYKSEEAQSIIWSAAGDLIDIAQDAEAWHSFADKRKALYDEKTRKLKERHKEAIRQERENKKKAVEKEKTKGREAVRNERQLGKERTIKAVNSLKNKYANKEQKRKNAKERAKSYGHILSNYDWLTTRLIRPTDDKHVPAGFNKALAHVLQQLDLQTTKSKALEEKYGPAQKTLKMRELRRQLEEVEKKDDEGIFPYDAYVFEVMNALEKRLDGRAIDDLSNEDLRCIDILLAAIRHNIANINQAFSDELKENISTLAISSVNRCNDIIKKRRSARNEWTGAVGRLDQLINESEVTPIDAFERYGGGIEQCYKALRLGFDNHVRNIEWFRALNNKVCGPYKNKGKSKVPFLNLFGWTGSALETWRTAEAAKSFVLESGESVSMTPAQIMSLYCLSKREQALGHIFGGGIVCSAYGTQSKLKEAIGSKRKVQTTSAHPTLNDVIKIISTLTPEQKKIADKMQKELNTTVADWGNETSLKMYGYRKFTEENYFPICSSDIYLDTSIEGKPAVEKIRNFGFTKGITVNANNSIVIDDFFTVVSDHINKMSLYNSFAAPIADMQRVFNYKERSDTGIVTNSVKSSLRGAFGSGAERYITNFMRDVNGTTQMRHEASDNMLMRAFNLYKKAAIGGNLRVGLQQPTAIVRAWQYISPKYFVGGSVRTAKNIKEMKEHCPIALWKALGNYQIDMARDFEDILMNQDMSVSDKLFMGMYGFLDNCTWAQIWGAVKRETMATHPDVKYGSKAFWDLCNARASEIFDKTQVVDSVFHRSSAMRSQAFSSKLLTAFMAEPTRTFNMVRTEYIKAWESWAEGDKTKAAGLAAKTTIVFAANAALVSAAAAIADALRGKGDDDDKLDMATKWFTNFVANFKSNANILNNIYFFKDVINLKQGFGTSNMGFEGWESLMENVAEWEKFAIGESKKTAGELIREAAEAIGYLTGIPVKNVLREYESFSKLLGIDVFASDGTEESAITYENNPIRIQDGSFLDNILNKVGINKTEAEIRQDKIDALSKQIDSKSKGLTGQDAVDAAWDSVSDGYTKLIEVGDVESVENIRQAFAKSGLDTSTIDAKILKACKTAYKKTIGDDEKKSAQTKLKDYMTELGIYEDELSDIVYSSDTARDLKAAMRTNNVDAANELLGILRDAGLTYDDYIKLYENRNRGADTYSGKYENMSTSTGKFAWPTESREITSNFGYRDAPTSGASTYHQAIDIGAAQGSQVVASDGGVVLESGYNSSYGYHVIIQHNDGAVTYYNHLYSYHVQEGDTVKQSEAIGTVGSTGNSTGPHLDFKIKVNGRFVDPLKYLA